MGKKIKINDYALMLNLKEATDLGLGIPANGEYNKILCCTCWKLLEDEDMWYVPQTKEIFCEECFDEYIRYNHPDIRIQDQCDIDNNELLMLINCHKQEK